MTAQTTHAMSPQDALIAVMMLMSAADREMSDTEMKEIGAIIGVVPVFENYDRDRIGHVAAAMVDLLQNDEGLDAALGLIRDALPDMLRETAYALACDVAAADGKVELEEMRLLERIRGTLELDRLVATAIERGSRARHLRLP